MVHIVCRKEESMDRLMAMAFAVNSTTAVAPVSPSAHTPDDSLHLANGSQCPQSSAIPEAVPALPEGFMSACAADGLMYIERVDTSMGESTKFATGVVGMRSCDFPRVDELSVQENESSIVTVDVSREGARLREQLHVLKEQRGYLFDIISKVKDT